MISTKPRVLIFDDDEGWAEQIALLLRDRCNASTAHTISRWRHEVSGTHWDAMVMDVQITGSPETGTDQAERAILEYGITSPIIVISGVWPLEEVEEKYRNIFFDYISKDNLNDLPESIDRACSMGPRTDHVKRMLTSFAKKLGMLKNEFPLESLDTIGFRQLFESSNGKTIEDFINMIWVGTRRYLDSMGRTVLIAMRDIPKRPT